ncbi:MerR family transcriptional regulator [Gephyromycinifex aptenodytis]|uniref:MerR family transcriptional regulator n=1 Tax=Gephyromycinifex aptenodytis TaxID=2716227 RepID=UPI001447101C|nr:MerR family transcriptional regulator [Gephyromycinifex aptenodytis]
MDSDALAHALRLALDPGSGLDVEALADLARDDEAGDWDIATTAEHLQLSPHTLRYYERVGLVHVERNEAGHRRYGPAAVRRLVFIARMRTSGMSIADLTRYIELADSGAETVPERVDLLRNHREALRRKITDLQLALAATEYKLATYREGPRP